MRIEECQTKFHCAGGGRFSYRAGGCVHPSIWLVVSIVILQRAHTIAYVLFDSRFCLDPVGNQSRKDLLTLILSFGGNTSLSMLLGGHPRLCRGKLFSVI